MSVEKKPSMLVFPPGICNFGPPPDYTFKGIALMLSDIMRCCRGGNQHAELLDPPPVVEFRDDSAGTLREPSVRIFEWTALIHDTRSFFDELGEKINSQLFYAWHGMASSKCAIVEEHSKDNSYIYFLNLNDEDVGVYWHDIQDRLFAWATGNVDRQSVYVVPKSERNLYLKSGDVPTPPYKLCANAQGQKSSFFCESNPISSLGSASKRARLSGGALMHDDVAHNELAVKETKKAKVLRWWAEAPPSLRDVGFNRIGRNEGPEIAEKCRLAVEIHRKRLAAAL